MKKTRILTNSFLLMSLIIIISTKVVAQTFTLKNTVIIDFGAVWCIPVYDGSNIVVSSESGGVIKVGKFDLSLKEVTSHATIVADTADTANNDSIADHKHIFQNGYHYLVFSTAGGGQGGKQAQARSGARGDHGSSLASSRARSAASPSAQRTG